MNWHAQPWRLMVAALVALSGIALSACAFQSPFNSPLLSDFRVEPSTIRPGGSTIASPASIQYTLGRRAYVTLSVVAADGSTHVLRDNVLRAPDQYETRFDGAVGTGDGPNRRLLPDGEYSVNILVVDTEGPRTEQRAKIVIKDADPTPLEVGNLVVRPTTITPNNDGQEDETTVSYSLSKKAKVTVFATDAAARFALIQPPTLQQGEAGLAGPWDGKENGGRLLANGVYTIHVQALDEAGNLTEARQEIAIDNGGTPRMAITKVKFWPPIVPKNGTLRVEITVKNIGETKIQSLGPDPGTHYSLSRSYASFVDDKGTPIYFERPGFWRVGVMWNNAPQPYPIRWGFGPSRPGEPFVLEPEQEATVTGEIAIDAELPRTGTYFWAGIEQGGVGFHDTNKGQTEIRFAY